jgi:F0F1-type ATP synthase assembly protein I
VARIPRKSLNNSSLENTENKKSDSLPAAYRKITPYLNIGLVLAGSVLFFTWLGFTLDKHWSTRPWLTVIGAFLGIFTGFYHFIKIILNEERKGQE